MNALHVNATVTSISINKNVHYTNMKKKKLHFLTSIYLYNNMFIIKFITLLRFNQNS